MKCESCGKRLKKSDEVCPECGRYIVRRKDNDTEIKSEDVTSAGSVCNENEIVFKDNIPLLILKIFASIVLIAICIYSLIERSFFAGRTTRDVIVILASVIIFVDAFAVFFNERGCRLTFENDRVHGTVPGSKFGKNEISIRYDEILKTEFVVGSKYSPSHISILLRTGDEVKIPCTRKNTLVEIRERIQKHLTELKISELNTTVIYHGETVEGSLINGKEYTLVNIGEKGMYEVIDESGETGFYRPELFEKEEHCDEQQQQNN